jgi:hypothetical protein
LSTLAFGSPALVLLWRWLESAVTTFSRGARSSNNSGWAAWETAITVSADVNRVFTLFLLTWNQVLAIQEDHEFAERLVMQAPIISFVC